MEKWEAISHDSWTWVHRMKVFGGWLIEVETYSGALGITFIPDPQHQWKITEKIEVEI